MQEKNKLFSYDRICSDGRLRHYVAYTEDDLDEYGCLQVKLGVQEYDETGELSEMRDVETEEDLEVAEIIIETMRNGRISFVVEL